MSAIIIYHLMYYSFTCCYVYHFIVFFLLWKMFSHERHNLYLSFSLTLSFFLSLSCPLPLSFKGNPNNVYYAAAWSSSTNVVAVGNVVPSAGLISHSSDGGMTWNNLVRTGTSNSICTYLPWWHCVRLVLVDFLWLMVCSHAASVINGMLLDGLERIGKGRDRMIWSNRMEDFFDYLLSVIFFNF